MIPMNLTSWPYAAASRPHNAIKKSMYLDWSVNQSDLVGPPSSSSVDQDNFKKHKVLPGPSSSCAVLWSQRLPKAAMQRIGR